MEHNNIVLNTQYIQGKTLSEKGDKSKYLNVYRI